MKVWILLFVILCCGAYAKECGHDYKVYVSPINYSVYSIPMCQVEIIDASYGCDYNCDCFKGYEYARIVLPNKLSLLSEYGSQTQLIEHYFMPDGSPFSPTNGKLWRVDCKQGKKYNIKIELIGKKMCKTTAVVHSSN